MRSTVVIFGALLVMVLMTGCSKPDFMRDKAELKVGDCFMYKYSDRNTVKVLEVGKLTAFTCEYVRYEDYLFRQCENYYNQSLSDLFEDQIVRMDCPESINKRFAEKIPKKK